MRQGMTLVEVLVALAIFALAAVGLSAAYGNILLARSALTRMEADDEALRLARAAVLDPQGLGRKVTSAGERAEGRVSLSDGTLAEWEAEITPATVDALFLVRLTIRREGDAEGRVQEFRLYRPGWSTNADRQARQRVAAEKLRLERGYEGTLGGSAAPSSAGRGTTRPANGAGGGGGGGGSGRGEGGPGKGQGGPGKGEGPGPGRGGQPGDGGTPRPRSPQPGGAGR